MPAYVYQFSGAAAENAPTPEVVMDTFSNIALGYGLVPPFETTEEMYRVEIRTDGQMEALREVEEALGITFEKQGPVVG